MRSDGLRQIAARPYGQASKRRTYVAERYASKDYLSETKRRILESIRDLARRIEHP
jgi:hypothetical protein